MWWLFEAPSFKLVILCLSSPGKTVLGKTKFYAGSFLVPRNKKFDKVRLQETTEFPHYTLSVPSRAVVKTMEVQVHTIQSAFKEANVSYCKQYMVQNIED